MKKIIIGLALLTLISQIGFAQTQNFFTVQPGMGATPPLQNNWQYTTPQQAFDMQQSALAPINNAINTYGQRQFEMNMQLQQAAIAAQQQQRQIQAEADAQQRQIAAEKDIDAVNQKESQEQHDQVMAALSEKQDAIATQLKSVNDASQSRIKSGIEAIENP